MRVGVSDDRVARYVLADVAAAGGLPKRIQPRKGGEWKDIPRSSKGAA